MLQSCVLQVLASQQIIERRQPSHFIFCKLTSHGPEDHFAVCTSLLLLLAWRTSQIGSLDTKF